MLHIINKSPFEKNSFKSAVKHATMGSTFLLIEDGVYATLANGSNNKTLRKACRIGKVVALSNDINARGIQDKISEQVKLTNYSGFVDLVTENERLHSWL